MIISIINKEEYNMHDTSRGYHTHCDHDHSHSHDESHNMMHNTVEKSDLEKLNILLGHWIEHNKTHQESFLEWAGKARGIGKGDTADSIEKAVEYMDMANKMLAEAKEKL